MESIVREVEKGKNARKDGGEGMSEEEIETSKKQKEEL